MPGARRGTSTATIAFWVAVIAVAALRLWATRHECSALCDMRVDDRLYMDHARAILDGSWLGPYHHQLLVKSPGYGILLSGFSLLGISRLAGEAWLTMAAGLSLLLVGLRLRAPRLLLLVAWAFWVLSPSHFTSQVVRVLRDDAYAVLSLLSLSLGFHLVLDIRDRLRRRFATAILFGLVTGLGAVVREEILFWFLLQAGPLLLVGLLTWVRSRRRPRPAATPRAWAAPAVAVLAMLAPPATVAGLNLHHYGVFTLSELNESSFRKAMGAIQAVARLDGGQREPLSRSRLEQLYAASPSLAFLRGALDGNTYRQPFMVNEDGDRFGIYTLYALRSAAQGFGCCPTATAARSYYAAIATEIGAAVREGRLESAKVRTSIVPALDTRFLSEWWSATVRQLRYVFTIAMPDFVPVERLVASDGLSDAEIAAYRNLLKEGEPVDHRLPDRPILDRLRRVWMSTTAPLLLSCGALIVLWAIGRALRIRRKGPDGLLLGLGLGLLAIGAGRIVLSAALSTYWFPTASQYSVPFYPFMILGSLVLTSAFWTRSTPQEVPSTAVTAG